MQYEQRPIVAEDTFLPVEGRLWDPSIKLSDGSMTPLSPTEDSIYVVVDDIDGDVVALDPARWPHLDGAGRLAFVETSDEWLATMAVDMPLSTLQVAIDRARTAADQLAPTRPIRVGDVFHVRGPGWPADLAASKPLDVTAAARQAAKIAHYGAIAPRVSAEEADRLALESPPDGQTDPPPPPFQAPRAMPSI